MFDHYSDEFSLEKLNLLPPPTEDKETVDLSTLSTDQRLVLLSAY